MISVCSTARTTMPFLPASTMRATLRVCAPASTRWCVMAFQRRKMFSGRGDIVNVDMTTIVDGYYADASRMFIVGGKTTPEKEQLVRVAKGMS